MPAARKAPAAPGLGIDLVEVSRIKRLALRNPRFLKRFFTAEELTSCAKSRNRYERLAARFAVKEAVVKALDDKDLNLRDIAVANTASGRPQVRVAKYPRAKIVVSISHTRDYASAAALVFSLK